MDQRDREDMTPFFLATGFLGSGKTTWLKRILNECADDVKIGVIQNEFAAASVDGVELANSGKPFKMLEINNGSVFCVCLLGDFITSLHAFVEQEKPDCVILEASGLSDPISIGEMLHSPLLADLYLAHIWSIVDASTFLAMEPKLTRIGHQVRIADTVIVNKIDLIDDTRSVEKRIAELNPYAEIVKCSYCDTPSIKFINNDHGLPLALRNSKEFESLPPGGRPDVNSAIIRISRPISLEQLNHFIDTYKSKVIRMKGFVLCTDEKARAIQTSFDNVQITEIEDYKGNSEIIAMGMDINANEMRSTLLQK